MRSQRNVFAVVAAVLAAIAICSVLAHGLPSLRHDWRIPLHRDALIPTFIAYASGWIPNGIGEAQPYPTFYFIACPLTALAWAGVPAAAIAGCVIAASIVLSSIAAMRLAAPYGGWPLRMAAACIASMNPWVFSKLVAGHLYMVFAYGCVFFIISEMRSPNPSRVRLALLSALLVTQIEFFLLVAPLVTVWAVRKRRYATAAMPWIAFLPILAGLGARLRDVGMTPYLLPWQESASVDPIQALLMQGYSFHYATAFAPYWPAFAAIALVGVASLAMRLRGDASVRVVAAYAAFLIVAAAGTRGPVASLYRFAVLHFPASGVFRELYDLVAVVPIAYVAGLSAQKPRWLDCVLAGAALATLIPWVSAPAFDWFVPAADVTSTAAMPPGRIAFVPSFQPLSLGARGSGVDPDAYVTTAGTTPLNEAQPAFPITTALASIPSGDRAIAALGVRRVARRAYLRSNVDSIRFEVADAAVPRESDVASHDVTGAMPLFSLDDAAPSTVPDNRWWNDAMYETDAAAVPLQIPQGDRATLDSRKAWIDGRLAGYGNAGMQTPFGGAFTESNVPLHFSCVDCRDVYAAWRGWLLIDARRYGSALATPRWVHVPSAPSIVRCVGRCLVSAVSLIDYRKPRETARSRRPAVTQFSTWWLSKVATADGARLLRYNERYSGDWAALDLSTLQLLPHVRIEGIVNGWMLDGRASSVLVVNGVSAIQAVLECLAWASLAVLIVAARRPAGRPQRRTEPPAARLNLGSDPRAETTAPPAD